MGKRFTFSALIEEADRGGALVTVPFDVEQAFGRKRVSVNATVDGVPYRGSLVRMGGERHILGILKSIRNEIGKQVGDKVEITLEEDSSPRVLDIPLGFLKALKVSPEAGRAFEALSFSHRREYVNWIMEVKRIETREKRITKAIEMLSQGEKHP